MLAITLVGFLRHLAPAEGIEVLYGGYVRWWHLRRLDAFHQTTEEEVLSIVRWDKKGRFGFAFEDGELLLRANQGHSFHVEMDMERVSMPCLAIHGTTFSAWETILHDGLRPMGRQHIHFASGLDASSGIRPGSEVLIQLDVERMLSSGRELWRSENGVLLAEGVICPCLFLYVSTADGLPLRSQCRRHGLPLNVRSSVIQVLVLGHSQVKRLQTLCPYVAGDIRVTASGWSGLRLDACRERFLSAVRQVEPSVVILQIGENDLCDDSWRLVFRRLTELVETIQSECASVRRVVVGRLLKRFVCSRDGNGHVALKDRHALKNAYNRRRKVVNRLLYESELHYGHHGLPVRQYMSDGVHLDSDDLHRYIQFAVEQGRLAR